MNRLIDTLFNRLINKEYLTERERKEWLNTIKERLEVLEKENEKLKEIIKENFGVNSVGAYFNYNAPVMEKEIKEVMSK